MKNAVTFPAHCKYVLRPGVIVACFRPPRMLQNRVPSHCSSSELDMKGLRSADDTSMTENRSVYRVTKANHIVGATEDWEPNKRSPKEIAIRLGNCISGLNNNMSGALGTRKSVSH